MIARRGDSDRSRSAGFALFVVLWFLVLLAAIGTYIIANARAQSALARNIIAAAHAEALADAGIAQAVFNRSEADPDKRWQLDGTPYTVAFAGGSVTIRLHDEDGKINPNLASPSLLAALFQALGSAPPQAASLAAAIVDWTRPPPKNAPPGADAQAFRTAYENAGRDYSAPHRAMESLDELQLVLGITPQLFAAAVPYLTIYTSDDAPDPRDAPVVVQQALAIDGSAQSDAAANSSAPSAIPASASANPAPQAGVAPAAQAARNASPNSPAVLAIDVTAKSSDGGIFARQAIVRLESDAPSGYAVLAWRRAESPP